MTDDARYGAAPLGKSVEEIEQESGNLTNDPREGEAVRRAEAAVVPAVVNGTTSGVPAVIRPDVLIDQSGGADDGRTVTNRDSSEEV
ncbi:hypothetical protein GO986_08040 [Deinococcus sp. HMF7620]|uniref:Uncharacterized protein n=1 Tax=Deinococcus arboris TaxID=2682977 RepID=A0A7C9HR47_9DEIO|nr:MULTISPECIES: hypothetical protein [Deinococcus]MBZ9751331.1 hypothetical protein [Deinococcus betulae]MVN86712.1 hypothetical protein [Deinococcus arboris]